MAMPDSVPKAFADVVRERRATPHFVQEPVPDADLENILAAGLNAPSAYNLQPWRFLVVRSMALRQRLRVAAMNQPKVEEAPVVLIACADLAGWKNGDLEEVVSLARTNHYGDEARYASWRRNVSRFFTSDAGAVGGIAPDLAVWGNRHAMIAFTTMMWMAETLGYDTAPMEGFDEEKVKAAFSIPPEIRVVALLAIGRRQEADKVFAGRFPMSKTVFAERWGDPIKF
jgi:nitroreductase